MNGDFRGAGRAEVAPLQARVEELIQAHDSAPDFMATAGAITRPAFPPVEQPGDLIGRYKLLEKLDEGGCGTVYLAEQEEPVRRRVALKVIKLGMDTKEVIARFDATGSPSPLA